MWRMQELMLRRPVAFECKGQRSATIAEVLPAFEFMADDNQVEILTERYNRHYAMCATCQRDGEVCDEGGRLLRRFNLELAEVMAQ
jgi:hypothetical protein